MYRVGNWWANTSLGRCYAATNGFPPAMRRGLLSDLHTRQLSVLPNKLINKKNVFLWNLESPLIFSQPGSNFDFCNSNLATLCSLLTSYFQIPHQPLGNCFSGASLLSGSDCSRWVILPSIPPRSRRRRSRSSTLSTMFSCSPRHSRKTIPASARSTISSALCSNPSRISPSFRRPSLNNFGLSFECWSAC